MRLTSNPSDGIQASWRSFVPRVVLKAVILPVFLLTGCGDDSSGAETGETVTVQGTITDQDGLPQEGLFAHIVFGPQAAAIGVASDETNFQGRYEVTGRVPAEQCFSVQIWVLRTESFSAAAEWLARETVGSCGTNTLDLQVEGLAPIPAR